MRRARVLLIKMTENSNAELQSATQRDRGLGGGVMNKEEIEVERK